MEKLYTLTLVDGRQFTVSAATRAKIKKVAKAIGGRFTKGTGSPTPLATLVKQICDQNRR